MPKGKGKQKGPDLSKMTEEERIAYLEQQAIIEEQEKQKKETMMRSFMQKKLEMEERFSRINEMKFNNQWLHIMREIKSKDLKRDIEILSQSFERIVDRKDSVIKALVRNLNESEEQYNIALRSHTDAIDILLNIQDSCLERLEDNFNNDLEGLKSEFHSEEQCINTNYEEQLNNLKNIYFSVDHYVETKKAEMNHEYTERSDFLKGKSLEEKHALRTTLEAKVNRLWSEFRDAQKRYNLLTDERKVNFENLKAKDERNIEEIEAQMKRINGLNDQIQSVKHSMVTITREYDAKNKKLKSEREQITKYLNILKKESAMLKGQHKQTMENLAAHSDETIKSLQKLLGKAEKILKIAERCRALESEEEKVLPFYETSLNEQEQNVLNEVLGTDKTLEDEDKHGVLLNKVVNRFKPLDNFWKRFNKVQIERIALIKEESFLKDQNTQLRIITKRYVDGLSINDESILRSNILLSSVKMQMDLECENV